MRLRLVLLAVFLLAVVSKLVVAEEQRIENYNMNEYLLLHFRLSSGLTIERQKSDARLTSLETRLRFFPKDDYRQDVLELAPESNPRGDTSQRGDVLTFHWQDPLQERSLRYGISSKVKTSNTFIAVKKELKFPIQNLEAGLLRYTKPTEYIDINDNIESQARTLVSGETDLFMAVFAIADWVRNNIKYDLSTLTADVVQKSSWVLSVREGVCDELTNLFISMLRSLGIPARFVSGVVYSNLDYTFGPHGWAEVYFPEVGWVPFDVTFGQYGWIDPSHVKLADDVDSGSPTAQYNWITYSATVEADDIDLETSVEEIGDIIASPLELHVEPHTRSVGPSSFVPILVTVRNTKDYYISSSIIVRKAPELTGKNVKEVLLRPREEKTVAWIAKLPAEAEESYLYTSIIEVSSTYGGTAASEIVYSKEYQVITAEEANAITASYEKKSKKKEFRELQLRCSPDKNIYYTNDEITLTCTLKNGGARAIFFLCFKQDCRSTLLNAGEAKQIMFASKAREGGRVAVVAENDELIKQTYVDLNVIKVADVSLIEVTPASVRYNDAVELKLTLQSNSAVRDVAVDFGFDILHYEHFEGNRDIIIKTEGKTLFRGLQLTIDYKDAGGKAYRKVENVMVTVAGAPWYARLAMWIGGLFS